MKNLALKALLLVLGIGSIAAFTLYPTARIIFGVISATLLFIYLVIAKKIIRAINVLHIDWLEFAKTRNDLKAREHLFYERYDVQEKLLKWKISDWNKKARQVATNLVVKKTENGPDINDESEKQEMLSAFDEFILDSRTELDISRKRKIRLSARLPFVSVAKSATIYFFQCHCDKEKSEEHDHHGIELEIDTTGPDFPADLADLIQKVSSLISAGKTLGVLE